MDKPILHPASEKRLNLTVKNMPQSMLLSGEKRVGLTTIAKHIAFLRKVTPIVILPEKDEKIDIEKGVISVDIMRRLYDETRTKTAEQRIIIIDYAERMTTQAQNAFLKLLEEPGDDVYFILVSNTTSKLLPTIISRTENLDIKPINDEQSNDLLDKLGVNDKTKRTQILFMAAGLPAELTNLATDNDYFEERSAMVRDARELLSGNMYQKLLIAQKYKDDRVVALQLLTDASNMLKKSIISKPQIDSITYIEKLLKAYGRIEANGNIRLCLASMAI
ncbi:MAG: AAA family ATPase [Candidatus Saccharibacteria bacterium]|nr:AAA family ATPase [Candidatus Saccharibacteria bacterium]